LRYLNLLTGLRGLAALLVFIAHAADRDLLPSILGWGFGQIGVMLFFVLSGFLMSHLYIHKETSRENIQRYAIARIGRVVHLYLLALLLSYLISNFIYNDFTFNFQDQGEFLYALIFIKAPYVFWTIPVEIQFYFVFVLFWWLYKKDVHPVFLLGFIVLCVVPSASIFLLFDKFPDVFYAYSFAFFIGVTTALFYEKRQDSQLLKRIARWAGFPFLILLLINLPEMRRDMGLVLHDNIFIRVWLDPLNWVIVYGLFLSALYGSKGLAFLAWRPFVFLGQISYGVYLLHYPFLEHLRIPHLGDTGNFVLALLCTVGIAYLSFHFFEKPIAKRIRNSSITDKSKNTKKVAVT